MPRRDYSDTTEATDVDVQARADAERKEREAQAAKEREARAEELRKKTEAEATYNAQPLIRLQNAVQRHRSLPGGDIHTRVSNLEALVHEVVGVLLPMMPKAEARRPEEKTDDKQKHA